MKSEWILWIVEGIAMGAAIMILFSRSVFYAGLNLLVVVLAIGLIFGLYGSEFLFISQIMIYGGGILVLILFATMVAAKHGYTEIQPLNKFSIPALIASSGVIVIITVWVMAYQPIGIPFVVATPMLGEKLILDYSLPLEVAGVLLLVSLIGATLSATQKPIKP